MPNNILFDFLGPLYDRVFSQPEPDRLDEPLRLPAQGWLLDLGGGTGRSSDGLQDKIGRRVICDLSFPMLASGRAKGIRNLVQASATDLPFAPGTFERILVVDALHHMPDQPATTAEMLRVLAAGGRLLIEEPDIRLFGVKLIALMETVLLMRSHFHTPDEIRAMAAAGGAGVAVQEDGRGSVWVMADKAP